MEPDRKVSVLLVDDQPNNLLALEAVLQGLDLDLVRARSGEEALLRVLDGDFAVILMDVQMPGMDGFETATTIRRRDRSKHTPIIFLTAFQSTEGQVFQGYALGAVDYLSKPLVPPVLRSKVAVFVDLFRKTEQVRLQAEQLALNQRREHERELAEERQRWELRRLREEAAREKEVAESMAQKAEELTRTIALRALAEEQLRRRASQQAIVADLGQGALEGAELDALLGEAVALAARELDVDCCGVLEAGADGALTIRAGVGWPDGAVGPGAAAAALPGALTPAPDEPVLIEDLAAEARFAAPPLLLDHGLVSGLSVVIPGQARPFGALGAFSRARRSFTRDDIHFLQAVAHVLAAAIRRAHDERELAAIRDELAAQLADMTRLHALGARLSNSLELPAVLEEVLAAVTGLQGADRGVLMLSDREREAMVAAAAVGFAPGELDLGELAALEVRPGDAASAVVCGGLVAEDAGSSPVLAPRLPAARLGGCQAVCTTPLLTAGGRLVGTIAAYFRRPHRPADREVRMVELYARQAAEFIDNARLYREIREADRRKDEFLAMLAHELRNPLAPLLNSLHLLGLGVDDDQAAEQVRGVAERQARHLARLVDDLLDVSRISNGKIQLRRGPLDLRAAVSHAVETARPQMEARRHDLAVDLPPDPVPLVADSARLEQILANLLNNAAKYTEPGGRIELAVARDGDDAVIKVRDTGVGIAPELLPRVFDLFTQEDRSLDRSQGGLGIGLTLVRRLVELHDGSVSASSAGVGRGSEFVVRLPAGTPATAGEGEDGGDAAPGAPGAGRRPKRVLIVDDNLDGTRVLARILRVRGHEVRVAHDGPSALEEARADPPDVVLLDIGLPGMDGYEVAGRLRELEGPDRSLLVAVTGYGQEEDRRRSREAGFDHHLVKPVDPKSLEEFLSRERPPIPSASP